MQVLAYAPRHRLAGLATITFTPGRGGRVRTEIANMSPMAIGVSQADQPVCDASEYDRFQ